MPFKSEKQRRYLWANEPKIAREWTDRYGAADGGIMRLNFASGINPEMQKIIATLRENNPGKYDKFTDQELAENFASITATGFNDDVVIDVEDVQNIDDWREIENVMAYVQGDTQVRMSPDATGVALGSDDVEDCKVVYDAALILFFEYKAFFLISSEIKNANSNAWFALSLGSQ